MALRLEFGRKIFPKPIAWRQNFAPGRSGSTATTSSTQRCPSAATSNPVGAVKWVTMRSRTTLKLKQSAQRFNPTWSPIFSFAILRSRDGAFPCLEVKKNSDYCCAANQPGRADLETNKQEKT